MIEQDMKTESSKGRLWTAWILSGLGILFMLMDGIGKVAGSAPFVKDTLALGFTVPEVAIMGILGLLSTLLFAIPRTSFLGALLLTGYLGGATATQMRVDAPLFSSVLFPVYLAVLFWGAVWLRDGRLRKLVSFRA
jgi:hypothetical protein